MFGLGAVAASLPPSCGAPVMASPIQTPYFPPAYPHIVDPKQMYLDVYTEGSKGERYKHTMEATVCYQERVDRAYQDNLMLAYADDLVVAFTVNFTGTVRSAELRRGHDVVLKLEASSFDNPNLCRGQTVQIKLNVA